MKNGREGLITFNKDFNAYRAFSQKVRLKMEKTLDAWLKALDC